MRDVLHEYFPPGPMVFLPGRALVAWSWSYEVHEVLCHDRGTL